MESRVTNNLDLSKFSKENLRSVTDSLFKSKWKDSNNKNTLIPVSYIILTIINFDFSYDKPNLFLAMARIISEVPNYKHHNISYQSTMYTKHINTAISRIYHWDYIFFLTADEKYFYAFKEPYLYIMDNIKKGL